MVNRHRGEIEAILDGKSYRLCLTLGALAELEHAFGEDDMLARRRAFRGRAHRRQKCHPHDRGRPSRRGLRLDDAAVAAMKSGRWRGRLRRYRGAAAHRDLHRARQWGAATLWASPKTR